MLHAQSKYRPGSLSTRQLPACTDGNTSKGQRGIRLQRLAPLLIGPAGEQMNDGGGFPVHKGHYVLTCRVI